MPVISVEHLSKTYRLGQIGTGTFSRDLEAWWAKARGKPNPLLRIGEKDHGNREGEELWALRDVSFTVEQGEVLGIIGRNGAGKSTLLKILSRVTAPTSGKVKVKGRIASLLEVGTGFHPELTGRENIYLNGAILGMKRDEITRKFDEIVDFSEVEKFIDTPVKRYSSGMYVRLAFAVAAHLDPEILVVDEVLAVGDVVFQKKCLGKMGDVARDGRTVLFVSHSMASIQQLTSRSLLLEVGNIVMGGETADVVRKYLTCNLLDEKKIFSTKNDYFIVYAFCHCADLQMIGFNRPLYFELEFNLLGKVNVLEITIGIENSLGARVLTSWQTIEGFSTGRRKLRLKIEDPHLAPGRYTVMLATKIDESIVNYYQEAIRFSLSDEGIKNYRLSTQGDKVGTFIPLEYEYIQEENMVNDNI